MDDRILNELYTRHTLTAELGESPAHIERAIQQRVNELAHRHDIEWRLKNGQSPERVREWSNQWESNRRALTGDREPCYTRWIT